MLFILLWSSDGFVNSWLWKDSHLVCHKILYCIFLLSGPSSSIIEDLKRQQPIPTVIYFYFDVNDGSKRTVQDLLSSMALGLSASSGQLGPLGKVYESC